MTNQKHFYTHLVDPEDIHNELEVLDMTDAERNHMRLIIESTMHHTVVDVLLEEMHDDHKEVFLAHVADDDHERIWEHLREHVEKPEEKIIEAIRALKDQLVLDIQAAEKGQG